MSDESNISKPPKKGFKDKAIGGGKALVAVVPWVGGSLIEIFDAFFELPLKKKLDKWREWVGAEILELRNKNLVDIEELQKDEKFHTIVMQATQIATRNHQEEKLEALRNAIFNAALPGSPEYSLQQMFLNFIDTCTEWHIRIFLALKDNVRLAKEKNYQFTEKESISQFLEIIYPELANKEDFINVILSDSHARGFEISRGRIPTTSDRPVTSVNITNLGKQFIRFISEPQGIE